MYRRIRINRRNQGPPGERGSTGRITFGRAPDVHVRLALLEAEAAVEAVRGRALLAGRQFDRDRACALGQAQRLPGERLADPAPARRFVDDDVVDPGSDPRGHAVD